MLQDVNAVAGCMPGAIITEQISDVEYKGEIHVRLGPAALKFNGTVEVTSKNATERAISLVGKGKDTKGASSGQMELSAQIIGSDDGKSFKLEGSSTITVIGTAASFGGRLMQQVGNQVLNEFGKSFEAKIIALATTGETTDTNATESSPPTGMDGVGFGMKVLVGYIKSLVKKGEHTMKVEISKSFDIDAAPEIGWQVLQDVNTVAGCMPGAIITEQISDVEYKGEIHVRLGPAALKFNGTVEVTSKNATERAISLVGKGKDVKGLSSGQMELSAQIIGSDDGKSFKLEGSSTITIIGTAASFGGRLMQQVGNQVLNEFGKSFEAKIIALATTGETTDTNATESSSPTGMDGVGFGMKVLAGYIKSLVKKR